MQRVKATHAHDLVLGVSGGLDSALALLVCHRAFAELNYPFKGIPAYSMPCLLYPSDAAAQ